MARRSEQPRRHAFRLRAAAHRHAGARSRRERAEPSDKDRVARAPRARAEADRTRCRSRAATRRSASRASAQPAARGPGARSPNRRQGRRRRRTIRRERTDAGCPNPSPRCSCRRQRSAARSQNGADGRVATPGGGRSATRSEPAALRAARQFDNPQGGGGQFGPEIQFDTKGVEFGPWIRRFIAQVKRNWLDSLFRDVDAEGTSSSRSTCTRTARITDLVGRRPVPDRRVQQRGVRRAVGSNPTQPLPPEYPADKAFFTVTFFYNEIPPR